MSFPIKLTNSEFCHKASRLRTLSGIVPGTLVSDHLS